MSKKNLIYYLPRVLSALIVIFFGLFILEAFGAEFDFGGMLSHLSLTFIVFVVAVVAWRQPKVGGWLFMVLAIFFAFFFHPFIWNGLVLGGVPALAGLLFLLEKPDQPDKKIY